MEVTAEGALARGWLKHAESCGWAEDGDPCVCGLTAALQASTGSSATAEGLREALEQMAEAADVLFANHPSDQLYGRGPDLLNVALKRARAALQAASESSDTTRDLDDDPMKGTERDGRHPDHRCEQKPCPHIPSGAAASRSDTSESGDIDVERLARAMYGDKVKPGMSAPHLRIRWMNKARRIAREYARAPRQGA